MSNELLCLLFTVFDPRFGPKTIYIKPRNLLQDEVVRNVAISSQIVIPRFMHEKENNGHGFLPFPDLNVVAFIELFTIRDLSIKEDVVATLIFVCHSSYQLALYSISFQLIGLAYKIGVAINKNLTMDSLREVKANISPTSNDLTNGAIPLGIARLLSDSQVKINERLIKVSEQLAYPFFENFDNIAYTFELFKKNFDWLITAILLPKFKILLITREKESLEKVFFTLQALVPHRKLEMRFIDRKAHLTQLMLVENDIIGVLRGEFNTINYFAPDCDVVADLVTGKVRGDKKIIQNKYIKKLTDQLKQYLNDPMKFKECIKKSITEEIITILGLILHASGDPVDPKSELRTVQSKYDKSLFVLAGEIAKQWNPSLDILLDMI